MTNSAGLIALVFISFIALMMFSNKANDLNSYQQTMYECISQNVEDKQVLLEICSKVSSKLSDELKIDSENFISFSINSGNHRLKMHGYSPVAECVEGETCYTVPAGIIDPEIKPLSENEP